MRLDSPTARYLAAALRDERFTLIDVGCSGGLALPWRLFGDRLQAFAFDPSRDEIERLTAAETHPDVHYIAGFVAPPASHEVLREQPGTPFEDRNPSARLAWWRTQAIQDARAGAAASPPVVTEALRPTPRPRGEVSPPYSLVRPGGSESANERIGNNQWVRTALADEASAVVLPSFLASRGVASVDFVKIDTDGSDFEILNSLDQTLGSAQVLALGLEVNFIGGAAANHHSFHNTDRFMRAHGYELMGLTVRTYASAALPFLYEQDHPAYGANVGGRPYQGDALYARDFGFADTYADAATYSDDKLLKLAAIMALFGRPDQAAEILIMFSDRLGAHIDIDTALNLLAGELGDLQAALLTPAERARDYAAVMADFQADRDAAYGGWRRQAALPAQALEEIAQAQREREAAVAELRDVKATLSWRATAPLRAVQRFIRGR